LRLLRRRFNQSALLAQAVARETGLEVCPDLLLRTRATPTLEGHGRAARAKILNGAIRPHPGRLSRLAGRAVLLVDDVMTSGATLRAATDAARAGGAKDVCVLALARVVRDA
jgi:predicted amidophosphoribosyltransferase